MKTVLSVCLAAKLNLKTMIIVDNTNLAQQWAKAIMTFTNFDETKIGLIKSGKASLDRPIVIGMAQSLLSMLKKDISKAVQTIEKAKIGLIIYDEVHSTSAAPLFSKISLLFRTQNILGLSATPFHTAAPEVLMKNTIGDIIYETNKYELKPEYHLIYYHSKIPKKKLYVLNHITDYIKKKAIYNKAITESENYTNLILKKTRQMLFDGHRVLIICFTKDQVHMISNKLTDNGIKNTRFYGEEREINYDENVLIVTYSFAGKGFDYKQLSCLILACPLSGRKSLIQTIGRVLRTCEDKVKPIVLDLIDMTVPGLSIRDVHMKKSIITNEFNCEIKEIDETKEFGADS